MRSWLRLHMAGRGLVFLLLLLQCLCDIGAIAGEYALPSESVERISTASSAQETQDAPAPEDDPGPKAEDNRRNGGQYPDNRIFSIFQRPLLEILHPKNGQVLDTDKVSILLKVEGYRMPSQLRESRICLALASRGRSLMDTCFEQTNALDFHASGLSPGYKYQLRAILMHRGEAIAVSVRNFRVLGVRLSDEMRDPVSLETALQVALSHHESGDAEVAEQIYRKILDERPLQPDALHLLGLVLYQKGDPLSAISYIERAIETNATFDNFYNSMGECLRAVGRVADSVEHYERAIEMNPRFLGAKFNLALTWQQLSQWDKAINLYSELADKYLEYQRALKASEASDGKIPRPDNSTFQTLAPSTTREARMRQCDLLEGLRRYQQAEDCLMRGRVQWPEDPHFYHELGTLKLQLGNVTEARAYFEAALARGDHNAELNMAIINELMGDYEQARAFLGQVLGRLTQKNLPRSHILIKRATILPRVLPSASVIQRLRHAYEKDLDHLLASPLDIDNSEPLHSAFSNGFFLTFHNANNRVLKTKLSRLYAKYCPALLTGDFVTPAPFRTYGFPFKDTAELPNPPQKRIKVGFLSRFFFTQSVSSVVLPLLQQLDRTRFEILVFALAGDENESISKALTANVDKVVTLPNKLRVCHDMLREELLDILVFPEVLLDTVEYFLSFGRHAPVQAVFWVHPDTTGSPSIDYYLGSEHEVDQAQSHYTETLHRLRGLGMFVTRPELPPEISSREVLKKAFASLLSFPSQYRLYLVPQSQNVVHPDFDEVLRRILSIDRLAVVFILVDGKKPSWTKLAKERMHRSVGAAFMKRVTHVTDEGEAETLNLVYAADVILDAFYFNYFAINYQAFAIGTPVVTLEGTFWRSRITAAMYREIGLCPQATTYDKTEYPACGIARSANEYVQLALGMAINPQRRELVSSRIIEASFQLFEDHRVVEDWEEFFQWSYNTTNGQSCDEERDYQGLLEEKIDLDAIASGQDFPMLLSK